MARNYWLVKQEPEDYSWSRFVEDRGADWTGVRNFQARNFLRLMKRGDLVLFYHSVSEKRVVGIAKVVREHFPDSTAEAGDWSCVRLAPVKPLPEPVTLEAIRADKVLQSIPLVKQGRLSVMPITPEQFERFTVLGKVRV